MIICEYPCQGTTTETVSLYYDDCATTDAGVNYYYQINNSDDDVCELVVDDKVFHENSYQFIQKLAEILEKINKYQIWPRAPTDKAHL